jgi:hypothetical protein
MIIGKNANGQPITLGYVALATVGVLVFMVVFYYVAFLA